MKPWTQEDCDRLARALYHAQVSGGALRSRLHHDQVLRRFCGGMNEREKWMLYYSPLLVGIHHGKRGKRGAEEVRTSVGRSRGRVWTARNRHTIPIQTDRSKTGHSGDSRERLANI